MCEVLLGVAGMGIGLWLLFLSVGLSDKLNRCDYSKLENKIKELEDLVNKELMDYDSERNRYSWYKTHYKSDNIKDKLRLLLDKLGYEYIESGTSKLESKLVKNGVTSVVTPKNVNITNPKQEKKSVTKAKKKSS